MGNDTNTPRTIEQHLPGRLRKEAGPALRLAEYASAYGEDDKNSRGTNLYSRETFLRAVRDYERDFETDLGVKE